MSLAAIAVVDNDRLSAESVVRKIGVVSIYFNRDLP
jgi:hypothetical protein